MRNLFKRLIGELFLPLRLDYTKPFSWGWRIVIAITFISLLIFSLPTIMEFVSSSLLSGEFKRRLVTNKDTLKAWLNFTSLTLEILIAILLGEILLTEGVAQRLKRLVAESQIKYQLIVELELGTKEINLKNNVDEIYRLLHEKSTIKDIFRRAIRLNSLIRETVGFLYPGIRDFYTRVVLLSLITSFPGGLYGLGAFILFALLSFAKVVGFYLDSPWLTI